MRYAAGEPSNQKQRRRVPEVRIEQVDREVLKMAKRLAKGDFRAHRDQVDHRGVVKNQSPAAPIRRGPAGRRYR